MTGLRKLRDLTQKKECLISVQSKDNKKISLLADYFKVMKDVNICIIESVKEFDISETKRTILLIATCSL